jgi:hypothetical protein
LSPPAAVQIFLDDSVARGFGYDDGQKDIASLKAVRGKGHTLQMADAAVLELVCQLVEGRFAWPNWIRARRALMSVLDFQDPVAAGGWEILDKVGVRFERTLSEVEHESRRQRRRTGWKAIVKAANIPAMNRMQWSRERGRLGPTQFRAGGAPQVREEIRKDWIDEIRSLESAQGTVPSFKDLVESTAANHDGRIQSTPPASLRLDASTRAYAHFALARLRPKNAYNPAKHANDALDVDLLRYLAVPGILCTKDKRLQRVLKQAGSWQMRWVLRPGELEEQVMKNTLSLDWP